MWGSGVALSPLDPSDWLGCQSCILLLATGWGGLGLKLWGVLKESEHLSLVKLSCRIQSGAYPTLIPGTNPRLFMFRGPSERPHMDRDYTPSKYGSKKRNPLKPTVHSKALRTGVCLKRRSQAEGMVGSRHIIRVAGTRVGLL